MFRLSKWVFAGALVFGFAFISLAEIPSQISFQGILKDSSGDVVPDGSYAVIFGIYDEPTGGDALWDEEQQVTTVGGLFTILLGSVDPIPDTAFDGSTQYLGIQIEDEPEMEGRLPIDSEAYSYRSAYADSAGSGAGGDTDWVIDGENIYRLDGNVGIGTANPTRKLQIEKNSNAFEALLGLKNASSGENAVTALKILNDADVGLLIGRLGSATAEYPGYGSPGESFIYTTSAGGKAFNIIVPDNTDGKLNLYVGTTATGTPKMIINRNGNIGIGTTNPGAKLDVNGLINSTGFLGDSIALSGYSHPRLRFISGSCDYRWEASPDCHFYLYDERVSDYRILIRSDGNVGIGTTNPNYKLDVAGNLHSNSLIIGDQKVLDCDAGTIKVGDLINGDGSRDLALYAGDNPDIYINTAHNVGMGTTSPGYKLHVNGTFYASTVNTGQGNYELYAMNQNVRTTDNTTFNRVHLSDYGTALGGFHVGGTSDPGTDNLVVDGNVGIGTSSPDAKLAVSAGNDEAASFRNNSASSYAVWIHNVSGGALSCGTDDASSAAFMPIAYNNDARITAIDCRGGISATGKITANSIWTGENAITGTCTSNFSGVAGVNTGGGNGVYGSSVGGYAGYFSGPVHVTGILSKGGGGFHIDHPLAPEKKHLYHSFVESPDMMNVYNGNVLLDENGEATVRLPDYFEALNKDFRYQLTCVGGYAPVYIADKIHDNVFRIAGGTGGLEISWQVTGIRQDPWADAHRIVSEVEKSPEERGKYLHAVEYGKPTSMAIR